MPDNTWFTPYHFPSSSCLSTGPSQRIVYQLDETIVVKVPYQYPVDDTSPEANDDLFLSLQSFALFKKESQFYNLLAVEPHPHMAWIVQRDHVPAISLERLDPVKEIWADVNRDTRMEWIQQLLSALAWVEKLGYTHGDIAIRNMGVDQRRHLEVYDFGSLTHKADEDFCQQVLNDHFGYQTPYTSSHLESIRSRRPKASRNSAAWRLNSRRVPLQSTSKLDFWSK